MLLDAAETLFVTSKARVMGTSVEATGNCKNEYSHCFALLKGPLFLEEPVLEENSKWTALKEVMKEIELEVNNRPEGEMPSYKTLIVAEDDRT